ncbi:GUN4 domain-containing protein [Synechococcus elongatus]|uniref:GUN4 domain-containing protein n=1 Tax=Synechococcus elongatus PCC 11802 TaxID=2283154 RepID=A0AAT9K3G4_SYNEL|nr:GUN4 domain-containing protein [Synechococcus elongatus]QFZ91159.1 GUN4 domain-containing protein [Synechococcus elongatus PCC 11802]
MDDKSDRDLDQRLAALEERINSYNQLSSRIETLEQSVNSIKEQLNYLKSITRSIQELQQEVQQEQSVLSHLEASIENLQDNLLMISDIDTFQSLQNFLKRREFKEADQETAKILMNIINKNSDTISPEDIERYPLGPLRITDRLWQKYSNGKFGFSIQLQSYRDLGGSLNTLIAQDQDLMFQFFDRIGWRQKGELIFHQDWQVDSSSPTGFLPLSWWITPYGLKIGNFILARLIKLGF